MLLAGLDDAVTFGAEFHPYEDTGDERMVAVFADGSRTVGDVLVCADGIGSRAAVVDRDERELLPAIADYETAHTRPRLGRGEQ
ncbi:MAG: hypothetical protein EKK42_18715 [Pseudonocardiaceae bacterium]|nr:MAG: hypothetical protein EKK42_18715 [Pseudonocardiaceae bacterium]